MKPVALVLVWTCFDFFWHVLGIHELQWVQRATRLFSDENPGIERH